MEIVRDFVPGLTPPSFVTYLLYIGFPFIFFLAPFNILSFQLVSLVASALAWLPTLFLIERNVVDDRQGRDSTV